MTIPVPLLEPGRKAAVIVDADDDFKAARAAMMKARKQIILVGWGWDFDAHIRFGGGEDDGAPTRVGASRCSNTCVPIFIGRTAGCPRTASLRLAPPPCLS